MTTNGTNTITSTETSKDERSYLYLAGIGVSHSIAYPMHNHICKSLSLPWTFTNQECATVEDMMIIFRKPTSAGGVVTMPYKQSVMKHLDGLDDFALRLGACNIVYCDANGKLRGTNTDWRGIKGCLESSSLEGRGQPACIIGAGGASRAAVYALGIEVGCKTIYIINRDVGEVEALLKDAQAYANDGQDVPNLIHVRSIEQAQELERPYYIVGTVPDFEPKTKSELEAKAILENFLGRDGAEKGVLLDMCYKPRNTRHLQLARKYGWKEVEGIFIIGHQIEEQYRLWAGQKIGNELKESAWKVLVEAAEKNPAINF